MERKYGIGDWNFYAETNFKIAQLKMGKFFVSFKMELFQRLANIFETAYHSLLGPSFLNSSYNKAGYTAIQSRMVGQEQYRKNHSEFINVTDRLTDQRTDQPTQQGVESRVRD